MSNGQDNAERDQAGHDDGGEARHDLSEPTVISHGATLSYRKIAEGAEVQAANDDAYLHELGVARIAIKMLAQWIPGETDDARQIAAAAHLLVAAWADRNRLLGIASPGFTRTGRFAQRPPKPVPKVAE